MDDLSPATCTALRRAVFDLRRSTRARVFAPQVHVGDPSTAVASTEPERADLALRADIVAALLGAGDDRPSTAAAPIWLTRVGHPTLHDLDLAWLAAARTAYAEAGAALPWFVVVTKNGWHRPATGEQRTWQRLRLR